MININKGENIMAYFNQEMKKEKAPKIKEILKKYNMSGSLSVRNHSTVCLTLKSGQIDFSNDNEQVNVYAIDRRFNGVKKEFLSECYEVLMEGNHNNSDVYTDYYDVGWYVNINIGRWGKPYVVK